jgi:folate-binding protein YgfZ
MSAARMVMIESPALLEFRGPDARRFLNGQLTQDVKLVAGGKISLPSCVTDAKGKLQFRVWITESPDGALWVEGPSGCAELLEARLTRYLIADDVEVADLTGKYALMHVIGSGATPPEGVLSRESKRFGVDGSDWWISVESGFEIPEGATRLAGAELEDFRIANGVPLWGRELTEGILPPEAGLDATDISYHKGCYIGQEVISRIKFAGKLNKRLTRLEFDADLPTSNLSLVDANGRDAGNVTSVSVMATADNRRAALGYLRRGVEQVFLQTPDGSRHPVRLC